MTDNLNLGDIIFDLPKSQSNVIKVVGVGGGGSNAINYMFRQGIKGVDFVVCNTDAQALQNSPVPNKIQLGVTLTEGLGAGADPEIGQQAAIESISDIEKILETNTKMLFITAGMGGGTGTGAAPVIAQLSKEKEILTVGIVTMPFQFEGKMRQEQAQKGIEKLRKQVDSLIVINNNKLREVYGNLGYKTGFAKADEVLATASRGIAEVITHHYTQNIDLKDAKTVLSNSGTAIMGSATALGKDRAQKAIMEALDSPLLNDNKITGAKNVLLLIVSGADEITIDEIGEISDYIQAEAGNNANIITGIGEDERLDQAIAVTVIATGFNPEQQNEIVNIEQKKIIYSLSDEQQLTQDLTPNRNNQVQTENFPNIEPIQTQNTENNSTFAQNITEETQQEKKIILDLESKQKDFEIFQPDLIQTTDKIRDLDVTFEIVSPRKEIKETKNDIVFGFNDPLNRNEQNENSFSFELSTDTKEINSKNIEVVEVGQDEIKKVIYSLEDDYKEEEKSPTDDDTTQSEINFKLKQRESVSDSEQDLFSSVGFSHTTAEQTLRIRTEERRKKMKEFNYKFHNSNQFVEEMEKEPAYKRQNIQINQNEEKPRFSKTTLSLDSNNELQLRSNNSFLHDNVD